MGDPLGLNDMFVFKLELVKSSNNIIIIAVHIHVGTLLRPYPTTILKGYNEEIFAAYIPMVHFLLPNEVVGLISQ